MCKSNEIIIEKTQTSRIIARVGDATYALSLLNTTAFIASVLLFAKPNASISLFDEEWLKDGFCVTNPNVPYWNSHDLCLYADTVLALILAGLYYALHKYPGMKYANALVFWGIPGIIGHGLGHGGIGKAMREDSIPMEPEDMLAKIMEGNAMEIAKLFLLPTLIFWVPLMKAAMSNVSLPKVVPLCIAASFVNLLFPRQFGFTYVQTVLMIAHSLNQLARPAVEKQFEYALYACLVSVPVVLVGWMESTQCDNFVMDLGGHLLYDAYIPVSMIVFYIACFLRLKGEKVKSV